MRDLIKRILHETRDGHYNWLKKQLPNTPDYIIQDLYYKNTKHQITKEAITGLIENLKYFRWELVHDMHISFDIFDDTTQDLLDERLDGEILAHVPNDEQRHQTQKDLIKQRGIPTEPIILVRNGDRFSLFEGWHRTVQLLNTYGEFTYPNVYIGEYHADNHLYEQARPNLVKAFKNVLKHTMNQEFTLNHRIYNRKIGQYTNDTEVSSKPLVIIVDKPNERTKSLDVIICFEPPFENLNLDNQMHDIQDEFGLSENKELVDNLYTQFQVLAMPDVKPRFAPWYDWADAVVSQSYMYLLYQDGTEQNPELLTAFIKAST